MVDRALGVFGLALALILAFAPPAAALPASLRQGGIIAGVLLVGLAIGLILGDRRSGSPKARRVWTSLRLQFFGDERIPTEIMSENVEAWYVLWSSRAQVSFHDGERQRVESHIVVPKTWTLFVAFKQPIAFREIVISFSAPGFPSYEIKFASERFAILSVAGDIPAGALEVYAKSQ